MNTLQTDFLTYFKNLDDNARIAIAETMPVMNPEGRILSETNCIFLAFQSEIKFTVVGGFKQWLKHGRCVKKGQHGNFIFIPAMVKTKKEDGTTEEELDKFLVARVFDISQTFEIKESVQKQEAEMAMVQETNPLYRFDGENFIDDQDDDEEDSFLEPWELDVDCNGNCYSDADPGL